MKTKLNTSAYAPMDQLEIEPLTTTDEPAFKSFLRKYHFAAGEDKVFNWYRSAGTTTMYAVKDSGKVIGTGMSYGMGQTGWIGAICVDEEHRRLGFGRKLTDYAVDTLKEQGCSTVLLRASETGAIVYESLGFRRTGRYDNFISPPNGWDLPQKGGYEFREITFLDGRHIELETQASGEHKGSFLATLPEGKGIEIIQDDELVGFAYPSVGDGFIGVASDEEAIGPMMAMISNGRKFKIRTLVGSRSNEFLHSLGYKTEDGAIRMALGEDPVKKIRNIVGTISSSIG